MPEPADSPPEQFDAEGLAHELIVADLREYEQERVDRELASTLARREHLARGAQQRRPSRGSAPHRGGGGGSGEDVEGAVLDALRRTVRRLWQNLRSAVGLASRHLEHPDRQPPAPQQEQFLQPHHGQFHNPYESAHQAPPPYFSQGPPPGTWQGMLHAPPQVPAPTVQAQAVPDPQLAPDRLAYARYDSLGETNKSAVDSALWRLINDVPAYSHAYDRQMLPLAGTLAGKSLVAQPEPSAEESRTRLATSARGSLAQLNNGRDSNARSRDERRPREQTPAPAVARNPAEQRQRQRQRRRSM